MTAPVDPATVNTATVPGFTVTEENKYTGTFVVEAFDGLIKAINEEAESQTDAVLGITFGVLDVASTVADTVTDPIGAALSALVGWVIEHYDPFKEALQMITGSPDKVKAKADEIKKLAGETRVLADDHLREMANFTGWAGVSAENYQASMQELNAELRAMADGTESKARIYTVGALLLALVYDEVRDMIAEIVGSAGSFAISIAITFLTFGGSAPATGTTASKAIADIGRAVVSITELIAKLGRGLDKLVELLGKLEEAMKMVGKAWDKIGTAADVGEVGYEIYKANNGVTSDINDAVAADAAKDQAAADLANVKTLGNEAIAANAEYKAAKDGEVAAAKAAQEHAKFLETQAGEAKLAGDAAQNAANTANAAAKEAEARAAELEKAAKSGDRDAFNDAKKAFEAAKDKFDSANDAFKDAQGVAKQEAAETTEAAKGYARNAANVAAWAEVSAKELAETDAPTDTAQNASKEFQDKYQNKDGGILGTILNGADELGEMYTDNANNTARNDQKAFETANLDAAQKNAAAATANAKAMETGSAADIAAADSASAEAKTAGEYAKSAGEKAQASGKQAQETYEQAKGVSEQAQNVGSGNVGVRDEIPLT